MFILFFFFARILLRVFYFSTDTVGSQVIEIVWIRFESDCIISICTLRFATAEINGREVKIKVSFINRSYILMTN